MLVSRGVLRHSMVSSCLLLAACGGYGDYKATTTPSTIATGGAPAAGNYAPAHASAQVEPARPYEAPPSSAIAEPVPHRPGRGTTFGESVYAPISYTPFQRSSSAPWAEVLLHYNDAEGVAA